MLKRGRIMCNRRGLYEKKKSTNTLNALSGWYFSLTEQTQMADREETRFNPLSHAHLPTNNKLPPQKPPCPFRGTSIYSRRISLLYQKTLKSLSENWTFSLLDNWTSYHNRPSFSVSVPHQFKLIKSWVSAAPPSTYLWLTRHSNTVNAKQEKSV